MRRLAALVAALALLGGCAPYVQSLAGQAGTAAITSATGPAAQQQVATLAGAAAAGARDEMLSQATSQRLDELVAAFGVSVRRELDASIDDARVQALAMRDPLVAAFDPVLSAELVKFGDQLRAMVRAMLDEALGPTTLAQAGAMRETLVGAPLRADIDAAIAGVGPKLSADVTQAIAPIKQAADAEATRWKWVAVGIGVAACTLFIALGLMLYELRNHRKALEALIARPA